MSNVSYADLLRLVEAFGFRKVRTRGSHSVFSHPECPGLLSLQSVRGQAKPYQIRQFMALVERNGLRMED